MTAMRERFASFGDRLLHPLAGKERPASPAERAGVRTPALVLGIGNPGAEYGNTRHNVGAWCIALLARRHGVELERHGRVDRAAVEVEGHTLHLARARAYVNESGPPAAAEANRLGIGPERLLFIYDDIDLSVGRMRIRQRGGHGGHNGVRSLIDALGSDAFARIRVGVDRPYDDGRPVRDPERIADWVLSEPGPAERALLDEAVARTADAVEAAVVHGIDIAMNRFNQGQSSQGDVDRREQGKG
jgi:PTH1 family peptidyl-tRNA hydrolase